MGEAGLLEFDPHYRWTGGEPDDDGDLDIDCPTLHAYHQRLWSDRRLPGLGGRGSFRLREADGGLIDVALGRNFFGLDEGLYLKSDSAIPTWSSWSSTANLRAEPGMQNQVDAAYWPLHGMGAMLLFPGRWVGGRPTISQAKGRDQRSEIADRLDLTIECIRRFYQPNSKPSDSPLGPTLETYGEFFELFGGFKGYIDFWLLRDIVTGDYSRVEFFMEGDLPGGYDFATRSPLPRSTDEYRRYLRGAFAFVDKRNARLVEDWNARRLSAASL